MERCPNCRARFKETGQKACQRCGMLLTGLWALEEAVSQLDKIAARVMLAGDMQQATLLLERRLQLKQDEFIRQLLAFTSEQARLRQQHLQLKQDEFVRQLLALTSAYSEQTRIPATAI